MHVVCYIKLLYATCVLYIKEFNGTLNGVNRANPEDLVRACHGQGEGV